MIGGRRALAAVVAVALVGVIGCGPAGSRADAPSEPIIRYVNGTIWTGVPDRADATTLATRDGTIIYVGDDPDIGGEAATETIDLDGRFLMPGFVDNHVHFFDGGAYLTGIDLRGATSPSEFAQRIKTFDATLADGRWILNGNWDHERWRGELPHRDWIDATTVDRPVFVTRLDGHMALANSRALELAGITTDTAVPLGGEISRDERGALTGIIKGTALDLVQAAIPAPSNDELIERFTVAEAHALERGLTQVHAIASGATDTETLRALRLVESRGLMKIRVQAYVPIQAWESLATLMAEQGRGVGKLTWGGIKGFVDGSLGASTAWLYEPYADAPATTGLPKVRPKALADRLNVIDDAGIQIAVHAIGDQAIDTLLDAFEDVAGTATVERRFRIEHFQHPTGGAIDRAAALGVVASMHPAHLIDDGRWAGTRLGPKRIQTAYAFRRLLDAGGILSFGSDWPVAPLDPLIGVYAAVTRATDDHPGGWLPAEKINVEEALRAYT